MSHAMRRLRWFSLLAVAAVLAGYTGTAWADVAQNTVVSGGNDTVAPGGATTVGFWIQSTSSGTTADPNGCDVSQTKPATVTINTPPQITASPPSVSISNCGTANAKSVSFSTRSTTPAKDYSITVGVTGGLSGVSFSNQANFTLHVKALNTPPSVAVSGPTSGASYEKGSVPAAACNVTDAEDGSKTFGATLSAVTGALAGYGLGSQTASCAYTDAGGLSTSASVTYSVVDTTKPVLTAPGDITEEATGSAGATASWTASATDAVDPAPVVTCAAASGSTFPLGSTAVTCTAKDVAGNSATKSFNVIVQDTTQPVLSLPSDITEEATGPSGATATWSASATDTVDGGRPVTCSPSSGGTFPVGGTPVNCSASDLSNNTASGGFTVTVQDTTPPTLHLPASTTLEATGGDGAKATYTATATDIVDGGVQVTCDSPSGTILPVGDTTVSCSAVDRRGNAASGSFTVSVVDTTAPVLTLPKDITTEATKAAGADVTFSVSATDAVDGYVAPVCDRPSETFPLGTTKVTCTATDAHDNSTSGSFSVLVTDTTAPDLAGVPGDQILEATSAAGATATFAVPTASDLVDGDLPVTCDHASGDTFRFGDTTVTCTATDAHQNAASASFTVTVQDTTAPVVTVPDNATVEATGPSGAPTSWTAASATDNIDGELPVRCSAQPGDTFRLGVTTVTCTATDARGNVGEASFTVTVQDTTAPVVTVPDNQTVEATGPEGAGATWAAVTATDEVDGPRPVTCSAASGATFRLGQTTVTCQAEDASGNLGYGAFVVTVQDTTAPDLTVPADRTVEATGPDGAADTWTATAGDIVDGPVTPECTPASGSTLRLGENTVSCTARDHAGNGVTKFFTVTVADTTAPALQLPSNVTLEATDPHGAPYSYSASATDLVEGAVPVNCAAPSGSTFPLGISTVTCTAGDSRDNTARGSFTVTVVDTTAPKMNALGDIAAFATSVSGAPVSFTATGSDLVDGTVPGSCTLPSGTTFAPGTTTVTCWATDSGGNRSGSVSFTVTVSFDFSGFLAPVDGNKVLNGMKAGSTAPIKWSISNQKGGYIGDLAVVKQAASGVVNCASSSLMDDLSSSATGSTSLRYDATARQYIYNWQSPKKAGSCYQVVFGLTDGTSHTAFFQLR